MSRSDDPAARLGTDEVGARAELWSDLPVDVFPADRDTLLTIARAQHAPPELLDALSELPAGRRFDHVYDVWQALGGETTPPTLEESR